eukprot:GEMP01026152.1.p2 GENE.GEMP01026152.1~~GEMP01026152.1.p2  ORF type:complete len:164 (+),score=49.07 GEMP01026152.1:1478-1969(+)
MEGELASQNEELLACQQDVDYWRGECSWAQRIVEIFEDEFMPPVNEPRMPPVNEPHMLPLSEPRRSPVVQPRRSPVNKQSIPSVDVPELTPKVELIQHPSASENALDPLAIAEMITTKRDEKKRKSEARREERREKREERREKIERITDNTRDRREERKKKEE